MNPTLKKILLFLAAISANFVVNYLAYLADGDPLDFDVLTFVLAFLVPVIGTETTWLVWQISPRFQRWSDDIDGWVEETVLPDMILDARRRGLDLSGATLDYWHDRMLYLCQRRYVPECFDRRSAIDDEIAAYAAYY